MHAFQDLAQVNSRRGINALKLGQILGSNISDLSVGTQEIETIFNHAVDKAINYKVTPLLIEGPWGGGKTHVLTLLQSIARKKRMATSYVIMDGFSVSLAKPMELMEEITNSICFPFGATLDGLSQNLRRTVQENKISQLYAKGAGMLAEALANLPKGALDHPDVCHLLEDYFSLSISVSETKNKLRHLGFRAPYLPTIKAYRLSDRSKAFKDLLTNWAHFAAVMGASGLLVIFDELDVEYASTAWLTMGAATLRERRNHVLEELTNLVKEKVPLSLAFASAPVGSHEDEANDAVANIIKIFNNHIIHVKVPHPDREQLRYLLNRLFILYNKAYYDTRIYLKENEINLIFDKLISRYERHTSAVPRHFVRMTLEVFDLLSTKNDQDLQHILDFLS